MVAACHEGRSADPVPLHLREPGHPALRKLGYGKGYKYPHDYKGHQVEQEYRPLRFQGERYYEPSGEGEEAFPQRLDHPGETDEDSAGGPRAG